MAAPASATASDSALPTTAKVAAANTLVTAGGMAVIDRVWPTVPGGMSDLETSITINKEPGVNGRTYWAHQWGYGTGAGGYVGLQQKSGTEKAINFSIWQASGWKDPGPGIKCAPFAGEGEGVQCHGLFAWRQGVTYKISIAKVATANWRATVTDTSTGAVTPVGTIILPSDRGGITSLAEWVENFAQGADALPSCAAVAPASATYGVPRGNKGTIQPAKSTHHTYGNCASVAKSSCTAAQVCTLDANMSAATAPPTTTPPTTTPALTSATRLKNGAAGNCLDLLAGGINAGLWGCEGGIANQRVRQDTSKPIAMAERSGQCLVARTNSTVGVATCDGSPAQLWRYDTTNRSYTNVGVGKCLDAAGGGVAGASLQVYTCNGNDYQRWTIVADGASARLKNAAGGNCLDLLGGGTNAGLWGCEGGSYNQRVQQDAGSALILAERVNACIVVRADSSVGSALCDGSAAQRWRYDTTSQSYAHIASNRCLEATGGGAAGAMLRVATCNGSAYQRWTPTA